jgi:hypothetical protein
VLNADNASELFEDNATSRATCVAAARPAAAKVVALAYRELLTEPVVSHFSNRTVPTRLIDSSN